MSNPSPRSRLFKWLVDDTGDWFVILKTFINGINEEYKFEIKGIHRKKREFLPYTMQTMVVTYCRRSSVYS